LRAEGQRSLGTAEGRRPGDGKGKTGRVKSGKLNYFYCKSPFDPTASMGAKRRKKGGRIAGGNGESSEKKGKPESDGAGKGGVHEFSKGETGGPRDLEAKCSTNLGHVRTESRQGRTFKD